MTKTRIESFTDAIIAIIMTILVLDLREPGSPEWWSFVNMGHKFIVYLISFVSLAVYWNNHHHLFHLVKKVDGLVLWSNNFFILMISFFPYVTVWVSDYPSYWAPEALYGLVIFGTNLSCLLLVLALDRANSKETKIGKYPKLYISVGGAAIAIFIGKLIAPVAVLVVDVLILLMWFIPDKMIEKSI